MSQTILPTSYFGPIQYFSKFLLFDHILVEIHENYPKQSYRNRMEIHGANGKLTLSAPITKQFAPKCKTKDILVDYATNWQKVHLKSIDSAYNRSPFYEFYKDDLNHFFEKKYKYLIDLNNDILLVLLKLTGISSSFSATSEYRFKNQLTNTIDNRETIHPKIKRRMNDESYKEIEYFQVFQEKHGFIENLSILDLLYNEGPNAIHILKQTIS